MKTASIFVVTALVGLAAASPQKRDISAKCDIKGVDLGEAISNEDKVDGAECQKLIDLFADSDDTYTVKESGWALGCATDCHVVIKATGDDFEFSDKEAVEDVKKILADCGDKPFTGTLTEDKGAKARKTAIYKFHSDVC